MSFRPLDEFHEPARQERGPRRDPCRKCKAYIGLLSPIDTVCFACWAGHPPVTRPKIEPHLHPHYAATGLRKQFEAERRDRKKVLAVTNCVLVQ